MNKLHKKFNVYDYDFKNIQKQKRSQPEKDILPQGKEERAKPWRTSPQTGVSMTQKMHHRGQNLPS